MGGQCDVQSLTFCVECVKQAKTGNENKSLILNNYFPFFSLFFIHRLILSFHISDVLFGVLWT